jgi:predicted small secreted protein
MKKLLCVVSVLMSLVVVGCGNSPDGDGQKLEAPAAPSL